jgi:GT2 family glycosyltransferase
MGDIFPTSYFFICNNDIFVSNGALDRMLETLKGDKVGIVGARCNSPSEGNSIFPGKELNSAIKYFQVKESLNRFANWLLMAEQATPERKVHFTAFYCTGFKMDMVKKIGLLDEDYNMGLFDDNDYCYRAEKTGWEIRIRKDSYIHHITSSTFKNENMDYQKLLDENRQVFIRKHGFDPWHY